MKYLLMSALLLSAIFCHATETEINTEVQTDPLMVFIAGNYLLVGKAPDSNKTYHGKLNINHSAGKLSIVRNISGVSLKGSASIEPALAGETKVLQMRFTEKGRAYEETCLISGDLDNYARISCYLYTADNKTAQPGIEALFHDPTTD